MLDLAAGADATREHLVLGHAARGHLDLALPHVALGPLQREGAVDVPAAELLRRADDANLVAVHDLLVDVEGDLDVLVHLVVLLLQIHVAAEDPLGHDRGPALVELDDAVVALLPVRGLAVLLLDGELVLDVAAGGNFDRSLPHVAVGPLEVHAVVGIPAAHLVRVAADDELLAVAELLLDLELDLDRVRRGARANGERARADRAALARAGEDAGIPERVSREFRGARGDRAEGGVLRRAHGGHGHVCSRGKRLDDPGGWVCRNSNAVRGRVNARVKWREARAAPTITRNA